MLRKVRGAVVESDVGAVFQGLSEPPENAEKNDKN